MSWPKPIVTLLRADPARKIPEKDSPAPSVRRVVVLVICAHLPRLPYVAHLSKSAFQEMKRRHRGAALEKAIAQWVADHDR
jgi:hypothetical protein